MNTLELSSCPVNSHNEWDPLEEVIIGSLNGAMFPSWNVINYATVPPGEWAEAAKKLGGEGKPYPQWIVEPALKDLAEFIHILEAEGVKVRYINPAPNHFNTPFGTPDWRVETGFCAANPRDPFMVIGNEILETPMADRCRYFEAWSYRKLFKEYFKAGAKWTAAPKPQLLDDLYDWNYTVPKPDEPMRFMINEFEPVFDAADFVRCGQDIFCQTSNVTNHFGIEWLQRHLGNKYRVHTLVSRCPEAIHIDTTFMPLAPGKVLVNPEYLDFNKLPSILKKWDLLIAPDNPPPIRQDPLRLVSEWAGINVLMLDEKRVIVEKNQEPLIKAFKSWGFEPITCSFEAYYQFLGSFHCATLDIRRRGELKSYF
ncbi:MAG: amidinotransferase [Desulfamplus sp.]|nr:amidinotransferase [Desulfamplus sp.]